MLYNVKTYLGYMHCTHVLFLQTVTLLIINFPFTSMPMQVKYAKNFKKGVESVNLLFLNPLNLDFPMIFNLIYNFLDFLGFFDTARETNQVIIYMQRDKHVNFLSLLRCFDGPIVCPLISCPYVHFYPFILCFAWDLSE